MTSGGKCSWTFKASQFVWRRNHPTHLAVDHRVSLSQEMWGPDLLTDEANRFTGLRWTQSKPVAQLWCLEARDWIGA